MPATSNHTTTTTSVAHQSAKQDESLRILCEWFSQNEVELNSELIEIRPHIRGSGDGFGIIAKQDLTVGASVGRISKKALLSCKTCGIADIIEEENLFGALALTIGLMYERALKETSPWWGYLQSLPTQVDLPMFWNSKEQQYLAGTDLGDALERDLALLEEDYKTHVVSIVNKHPHIFMKLKDRFTFQDFLVATSLVTSRSFHVDMYHGDCMVPFSDIFNHKTGGNHVRLEGDGDVCPECGSPYGCLCYFTDEEYLSDNDEWDTEEEGEDQEEDQECQDDDHHHGDGCCGEAHCSDIDSCPSELDDAEMSDDGEILDMIVVRPCKAGDEVFNTYGEHSNTSLLHRYGFVEDENENNAVLVTMDEIHEAISGKISPLKIQKRGQIWMELIRPIVRKMMAELIAENEEESTDEENTVDDEHELESEGEQEDDDDDDVEDFRFEYDGRPCLSLLAFLGTLFMKDSLLQRIRRDPEVAKRCVGSLLSVDWQVSGNETDDKGSTETVNATSKGPLSQTISKILQIILMNRLKRYPTSRDQDESDFNTASLSSRVRNALQLRLQEREIISSALSFLYQFQ